MSIRMRRHRAMFVVAAITPPRRASEPHGKFSRVEGTIVHLRLGGAALCGVAGPMPGTRDTSAVTCERCRTLIAASKRAPERSVQPEKVAF